MEATTEQTTQQATILERSVCLVLRCHQLGNTKSARNVDLTVNRDGIDVRVNADRKEWSATKRLLSTKDIKGPSGAIDSVKAYLRSVSTPMHHVFGPGTYLIPLALYSDVEARLAQYRDDLTAAVDVLVSVYPVLVEARRQSLGLLFRDSDYMDADALHGAFGIDWNYVSFSAPDRLRDVDKAAYEVATAKHAAQLSTAYDEVVLSLRSAALEMMRGLATRLSPSEDGKRKVLRSTALDDLREFIEKLPALNITDDTELPDALARVQAMSAGVDVLQIKSDDTLRASLLEATEQTATSLDGLVRKATQRAISFDEV